MGTRLTRRALFSRLRAAGATVEAGGLLASCGDWPRPPVSGVRAPAPSPSPGPLPLTLALPAEPRIDLLPLLHLVESGFLLSRGVHARLIWGRGPYGALPELIAGRAELAMLDVPTAARAAERKLELLGVFQLYGTDPSMVFALDRSGIRGPADLRGRRVGVVSLHLAPAQALIATLRSASLDLSDVELIETGAEAARALERGQVAALAASGHLAPWIAGRGLALVYLPRAGWEIVPGPTIATTPAFLAGRRAQAAGVVRALRAGIEAMLADPSGIRATAERIQPAAVEARGALRAQVDALLLSLRADDDRGPGWASPERYAATERYLRALGATAGGVELARVFVNDLLAKPGPG